MMGGLGQSEPNFARVLPSSIGTPYLRADLVVAPEVWSETTVSGTGGILDSYLEA